MPAPSPGRLFLCFLLLGTLIFLRPPDTSFVFDEQEALLGNPYLNGPSHFLDAFRVDFWGRSPARTIGSYRPLPNLLWWPLRATLNLNTPWFFCLLNLVVHALTCTLLSLTISRILPRSTPRGAPQHLVAWGAGIWFCVSASSTEAVCSAVGLADLLVGLLGAAQMMVAVRWAAGDFPGGTRGALGSSFALLLLSFFAKETALAMVAWSPLFFWLVARPGGDRRRTVTTVTGVLALGIGALVSYVLIRRVCYPAAPADVTSFVADESGILRHFFSWFQQPKMPRDPLNNPLIEASPGDRWATGLRLFFEQMRQLFFPYDLSSEHSFPRESVSGWGGRSILGLLVLITSLGLLADGACRLWSAGAVSSNTALVTSGALLLLSCYLPISNLFVFLPTVRGDRLLYPVTLGVSLLVAAALLASKFDRWWVKLGWALVFSQQVFFARVHAFSFRDDLAFWQSAASGDRPSAKSLLNLGVMVGARGNEEQRLLYTKRALQLAPNWPMGQVYLGDVYCRLGDLDAAWQHYRAGFSATPNSKALTALGLQCLYEKGEFERRRASLLDLAVAHPETWLDYFVSEMAVRGELHHGIPEQYRPRKYNARADVRSFPERGTSQTDSQPVR